MRTVIFRNIRNTIIKYIGTRNELKLTTMIGDIISTYLEDVEEYLHTEEQQLIQHHLLLETLEKMIAEQILYLPRPQAQVLMRESRQNDICQ